MKYASYKKKQNYLADLFRQASVLSSELELEKLGLSLKSLGRKIYTDSFKIQIVGTFKNGKSTFINSFLGDDILPAYALPCTAVINEVKYGDKKKAILHFKNPIPESLPVELSPKAKAHMKKYLPNHVPPMEISFDEIEEYVVIPIGKDPREMLMESPYEKVELFWPLEILKNGVEIIDSPGLNEHATRTKVTMDYLANADAIIFVLSATSLCSLEEMKFIENNLHAQGFNDIFFVVNRFDLIGDSEKRSVIEYARSKLAKYTSFGNEGIFFLSAKDALDGKKSADGKKYISSNMAPFEERLSNFLTNERGNAKLSQPTYELRRIVAGEIANKIIPNQKKMISTSLDELKTRYNTVKPRFEDLKEKKANTLKKIKLEIENSRREFENASYLLISGFSGSVYKWVSDYTPKTKLGVFPGKEKIKKLTMEITDYVSERITAEQNVWRRDVLVPLLEKKSSGIFSEAESDCKVIFDELDGVSFVVCGGSTSTISAVPVWKRITGISGDRATGILSATLNGGAMGLSSDVSEKLGSVVGSKSVLMAVGHLNPFRISAYIFGSVASGFSGNENYIIKNIKEKISKNFTESIRAATNENVALLTDSITDKLTTVANYMLSSLDAEISQSENQIKVLIAEMEEGRGAIDQKRRKLDQCLEKCKQIITKSDSLVNSFRR